MFYLRLYGVGNVVNNYSNSQRGNPLSPLRWLLFSISSKGFLYALSHRHDSTYHGYYYTTRGTLAQWVYHERSI